MRVAIVLANLGGPDRPEAIQPFLTNLFSDKAIIDVPAPVRGALARLIAARRAPAAKAIYAQIGGRSPILAETQEQAAALEARLSARADVSECRVFVAMRYWAPLIGETAREVEQFRPERIVLLPLYPQFSTTTTASFVTEWHKSAGEAVRRIPTSTVCCYPTHTKFVQAHARLIEDALSAVGQRGAIRMLFSAHGLPERVIAKGDPYQWQVERTAAAVMRELGRPDLDWRVCYQSRVGPLQWIKPSTDDEIKRAGAEGVSLIVSPIAFVSEHSETLVELDIEYRHLAQSAGVPAYFRIPALGTHPAFIGCLADLVDLLIQSAKTRTGDERRSCLDQHKACPLLTQDMRVS